MYRQSGPSNCYNSHQRSQQILVLLNQTAKYGSGISDNRRLTLMIVFSRSRLWKYEDQALHSTWAQIAGISKIRVWSVSQRPFTGNSSFVRAVSLERGRCALLKIALPHAKSSFSPAAVYWFQRLESGTRCPKEREQVTMIFTSSALNFLLEIVCCQGDGSRWLFLELFLEHLCSR